ncbi:transmembrane protein, putative [Medicago truncatula]|uniref:Transmembrane protein, putative n=1 Tax=Medicago truncatula TaxID=3880 RepID=A0A072U981_MEDTR|nr:transmembrane protein, putative [Medicago truncatula]
MSITKYINIITAVYALVSFLVSVSAAPTSKDTAIKSPLFLILSYPMVSVWVARYEERTNTRTPNTQILSRQQR